MRYAETVSTVVVALGRARARARTSTSSPTATARGLETIGGAREAKAIIILNPADPPIMMRNTIYAEIDDRRSATPIEAAIDAAVAGVAAYVPGYRLTGGAADRRRRRRP